MIEREGGGGLKSAFHCILSGQGKKFSHEGDTFIYPHLHQQNQSVRTRNNAEYNGFIVPLKKNYFLLVAGAPHQNYCIRIFISYGPTPNLGPVYMEWGTPV